MSDAELSRDALLGGRVSLWQPVRGYRAGIDAVLLAASVPARSGDRVLELGCGVGAAALCLAARVPGLRLVGVERDPALADLARRNAAEAGADMEVATADLVRLPEPVRRDRFDHVMMNPPYFRRDHSSPSGHPSREAAMGEETPLAAWIDAAARRLAPRGWLTLVHRADRLGDVLSALPPLGSVSILPVVPRAGRPARLVLVRARKDGRAPLSLLSPLQMHDGPDHLRDGEDYSAAAQAILRGGGAAPWEDTRGRERGDAKGGAWGGASPSAKDFPLR